MLSAYVSDHQRDWDSHLPYVMMAYRSAKHETATLSTQYVDAYLMFREEDIDYIPNLKPFPT
jgi:hypothetical protein